MTAVGERFVIQAQLLLETHLASTRSLQYVNICLNVLNVYIITRLMSQCCHLQQIILFAIEH